MHKVVPALIAVLFAAFAQAGPVNLNSADAATLAAELKGIGPARAQAIIDYRTKHGAFRSPDELGLVPGIGQKVIEQNRANLLVGTAPRAAAAAAPARPAAPPAAAAPASVRSAPGTRPAR